jgi:lipopolysaccharide export system protein LptA
VTGPRVAAFTVLTLAAMLAQAAAQGVSPLGGLGAQDNGKPIGIEASNGIEWQQSNRVYIAHGDAKATRGDTSVFADTLYAYYRPVAQAQTVAVSKKGAPDPVSGGGGSTEIYRLEADGHVRFTTPTQTMTGDHAVYDVDQTILVVTGKDLRLVTPRDTVTARDSIEWYDAKQLGVARGDALAVRDDRRVRGDVLTALMQKQGKDGPSRISRINANGNVIVSSADQIARGDAGIYNLDSGIATLAGHVRLTRGDNELRGRYGVVDLNSNVSRLLSAPPGAKVLAGGSETARVEGLLVPRRKPETP